VRYEWEFVAFFPLNVSMVHSSTLIVTTDCERLTYGGLSHGKTVHFGSLEFITDCFSSLSLSLKGNDSGTVFVGMAHSGSASMHTILVDSINMFYMTSSGEGSSGFPISRMCSMGILSAHITITPWPEGVLTPQTMATVPLRTIAPRSDTRLCPE
jgi:hypothetical protein